VSDASHALDRPPRVADRVVIVDALTTGCGGGQRLTAQDLGQEEVPGSGWKKA
jgi:hypothetical protein